ncbi:MAG: DUF222 domain-containing protein [Mycobacteriales bacterium]
MIETRSEFCADVEPAPRLVRSGDLPTEDPARWEQLCCAVARLSVGGRAGDAAVLDYGDGDECETVSDVPALTDEDEAFLALDRDEREGVGGPAIFTQLAPDEHPVASSALAASLDDGIAPDILTERGLVEHILGFDRLTGWAEAKQSAYIAELASRQPRVSGRAERDRGGPGGCSEYVVHELSAMLSMTKTTAEVVLDRAVEVRRLPTLAQAWQVGVVSTAKVAIVIEETRRLPESAARAVEAEIISDAARLTTTKLRRRLRRLTAGYEQAQREKAEQARADRKVVVYPLPDGMANLVATLPAELARLAYLTLCEIAQTAPDDDTRSVDARRADALVHLITCQDPACTCGAAAAAASSCTDEPVSAGQPGDAAAAPVRDGAGLSTSSTSSAAASCHCPETGAVDCWRLPSVQVLVTIAASTLLGLDDDPGELAGHGPVPAAVARMLAADATWRRLIVRPDGGTVISLDRTSYRPGEVLGDHIRARDVRCRFPTCSRAASDKGIDLDHSIPWPAGPTTPQNLTAKCRAHHRLKTHGKWQHQQRPDGTVIWTSPLGQRYEDPLPAPLEPIRKAPDPQSDEPPF